MELIDWFNLSRVGLLYDAVGAFILAWGYITQGKKEFEAEVAFYGPNEPTITIATKFDSIVGLTLIIMGFIAQLIGSDPVIATVFSSCAGYALISITGLFVGGSGYLALRKSLFKYYWQLIKPNKDVSQPPVSDG